MSGSSPDIAQTDNTAGAHPPENTPLIPKTSCKRLNDRASWLIVAVNNQPGSCVLSQNKEFKRELFKLYFEQTWLQRHESKIEHLLQITETSEERDLIIYLLKNFNYINEDRLLILLQSMADRICNCIGVTESKTQIITTAIDNEPDSSQMLLQMLKSHLSENGFPKFLKRSRGHEAIKNCIDRPNIIMVEDFSGTGRTIVSRVKDLNSRIQNKADSVGKKINPRIVVCLLTAMRNAIQHIRAANIEVYVEFEMPAGISQRMEPAVVLNKLGIMRDIETRLEQARMSPFPTLGYGQAEATFCIQNANPPNNNFPVFWWKHLLSGEAFIPLLERDEPRYEY